MNSNQIVAELTSDELKTREVAEEYIRIEQNTEFLTNVVRFQPHKRRLQLKLQQALPDIKSMAALTVQLSYILFTCHVSHTNIYISHKMYFLSPNKKDQEVCREYILQKDLFKMSEEYQQYLTKHFARHEFSANNERAYGQYTLHYINQILTLIQQLKGYYKRPPEEAIVKQFKIMGGIVKNFIEPKIKSLPHYRVMILALEESQLFREHSILLKVMNNSIFTAIRMSKHKNIFEQICKMEYNLAQLKTNKSQKDAHAKQIEASIQNLFRFLIKCQIITVDQSINDLTKPEPNAKNQPPNINPNNPNPNTKPYVFGEIEGTSVNDRKYTCRILLHEKPIREFTPKIYDGIVFEAVNNYLNEGDQQQNEPKQNEVKNSSKNEYLIQYMAGKNIISVKYTTAIDLNIENTDLIMFQCNSIAFHWSNVSMELVEKVPNKPIKKKQRYLAFKTLSHLHISERPLFKLLIMLDLVMLCAKISEPELRKTVIKPEDYNRIEEITEKVDHMIKLFIKKVERHYKIISELEFSKITGQ